MVDAGDPNAVANFPYCGVANGSPILATRTICQSRKEKEKEKRKPSNNTWLYECVKP